MNENKKITPKSIFEICVIAVVAVIFVIFLIRIFAYSEKSFASELIFSKQALEIYNEVPDEFVIYEIPSAAVSSGLDYTLSGKEIRDTTNYTVSNMVYFDATEELQLTVKYPKRELKNQDVIVPYKFTLEDGEKNRYELSSIQTKLITGYVYCRVTFENINIFKTNQIGILFSDGDEIVDARLIYSTLDRISEDRTFNVYSIGYSDIKHKMSFRIRHSLSDNPEITVRGDGAIIKPSTLNFESKIGNYATAFVELEDIDLANFEEITVEIDGQAVKLYNSKQDKAIVEDLSDEKSQVIVYYPVAKDKLITPVKKLKFKAPKA